MQNSSKRPLTLTLTNGIYLLDNFGARVPIAGDSSENGGTKPDALGHVEARGRIAAFPKARRSRTALGLEKVAPERGP